MIQCLQEISGGTDEGRDTEEWTRMIDRGRLWRIKDDVFSFCNNYYGRRDQAKVDKRLSG